MSSVALLCHPDGSLFGVVERAGMLRDSWVFLFGLPRFSKILGDSRRFSEILHHWNWIKRITGGDSPGFLELDWSGWREQKEEEGRRGERKEGRKEGRKMAAPTV